MRKNYTLIRLYLDMALRAGAEITLEKANVHYLLNVLRKSEGDRLRVFNGRDGEWSADVTTLTRKLGQIRIKEQLRQPKAPNDIWLCFSPIKKHRTAFIVEKATELGVGMLQPVFTQRTQFPKVKPERVQSQMIEASEQTERLNIPVLSPSCALVDLLEGWPNDRTLIFADEAGEAQPAAEALSSVEGKCGLLIGPEGGFTAHEREQILNYEFVVAVSLGPRILRADTAALSLLALWQALKGDWR